MFTNEMKKQDFWKSCILVGKVFSITGLGGCQKKYRDLEFRAGFCAVSDIDAFNGFQVHLEGLGVLIHNQHADISNHVAARSWDPAGGPAHELKLKVVEFHFE